MKRLHTTPYKFILIWIVSCLQCGFCNTDDIENSSKSGVEDPINVKDSRGLFSPRMDYDQWTPLGRGDPLKNDPTYDYVPPVLDRVHYWIDPASRKPDPPLPSNEMKKTEILVLGVSSKKPSTASAPPQLESRGDIYDPFLKFVDAPKFNYHSYYSRPQKPQQLSQQYSSGSSLSNNQNYYSAPYFSSKIKFENEEQQRVPYTMLMPPPVQTLPEILTYTEEPAILNDTLPVQQPPSIISFPTSFDSTTPESTVSIAAANLVYHSSSASNENEWKDTQNIQQYATIAESSSQVTWRTPIPEPSKNKSEYDEITTIRTNSNNFNAPQLTLPSGLGNMQMLQVGDKPTDIVAHVTVGGMSPSVMHKGQVSDDTTIDIDNTYVNIGKPNAQMYTLAPYIITTPNKVITHKPYKIITSHRPSFMMHPNQLKYINYSQQSQASSPQQVYRKPSPFNFETSLPINKMPMTLQSMQQTMLPPLASTTKAKLPPTPLLQNYIQPSLTTMISSSTSTQTSTSSTSTSTTTTTTTNPPTPSTTTPAALTTDPLFSHYKQPSVPLRGPMYLIIQGHSKVKTYGANKSNIHGIPVNDLIPKKDYSVKHLQSNHLKSDEDNIDTENSNDDLRRLRVSKDLQTLQHVLKTGLGAVDFATLASPSSSTPNQSDDSTNARRKRDYKEIKETIIGAQYKVVENGGNHTTEVYRKGIVEAGDISDLPRINNNSSNNTSKNV
ncbi:flocculation protein FLO11-like [Chrysoperla carnea]|uniref:flocculation protein FLO11-like n=1 Tax=Chrysoperla carnea TaxID=189513 RepID=UPI001D08FB1F|nr:flocculation protein FLO11-like [Chrysoperla carnea]